MDFVGYAEQLGKLGTVTILLTMVIALGYFIWDTTKKDRERTDALVGILGGINMQLELSINLTKQQQEYIESLVRDNVEHYRDANIKCKDDILVSVQKMESHISSIKEDMRDLKVIKLSEH